MEKTTGKHSWFNKWFIAFLAIAIVFLAVGLGTLGSAAGFGKTFELKTERDESAFNVVVQLTRRGTEKYTEDGEEKERSYTLNVTSIYLNIAEVYAEAGTPGVLRMEYGSGSTSFSSSRRMDVELENFFTAEAPAAAAEEEQLPVCEDALFRWVHPFDETLSNWTTSHTYVRFTAMTHDILINEIVFVGQKLVDSKPTGEYMVVPAEVYSATPNTLEAPDDAKLRAQEALFDAQEIPSEVQSSYYNFTQDELYTLSTLAEMRRGEYDEAHASADYHVEGVYGSLGTDLIALGTLIFGTSPFGLRFFPMLASFGVLVFGYLFVKQLTKSDKAGVVFAVLYALCNLSLAFAHVGNPLMIGLFFFVASLCLCHRFYANGMQKMGLVSALPLIFSGLCGAAAICVNGAYLIPVAGIVALFVCGMIRQQKARRYYLDAVIQAAEAPEAGEEEKQAVGAVVQEYRMKNIGACVSFGLTLVLGSILFAVLFAIPLYAPYLRLYTTASAADIFTLAAHAFAGGFVGVNPGAGRSAWELFAVLFRGTGAQFAVTAAAINAVAAVAGIAGLAFAIYRIVTVIRARKAAGKLEKAERAELRTLVVPLAGLALSLVMTAFGGGAAAFLVLAYTFAFALAAHAVAALTEWDGKIGKAAKICTWVGFGLLVAMFALYAVFTFSIPLSEGLIVKILG